MNFWQTIRNLIQGQKVSRAGWAEGDNAGSYLLILSSPANTAPDVFICNDNVNSKNPFAPTEDDMAATDWYTN